MQHVISLVSADVELVAIVLMIRLKFVHADENYNSLLKCSSLFSVQDESLSPSHSILTSIYCLILYLIYSVL